VASDPLENCTGFDWNDGNAHKKSELHRATPEEAEGIFFRVPLVVRSDSGHSKTEKRYYALGETDAGRRLFAVFTVRRKLIRIVSARDMNRNETRSWEKYEKENS
jgi:uncharacterized protein